LLFCNVYTIDLQNSAECMWWFVYGSRMAGIVISADSCLEAFSKWKCSVRYGGTSERVDLHANDFVEPLVFPRI